MFTLQRWNSKLDWVWWTSPTVGITIVGACDAAKPFLSGSVPDLHMSSQHCHNHDAATRIQSTTTGHWSHFQTNQGHCISCCKNKCPFGTITTHTTTLLLLILLQQWSTFIAADYRPTQPPTLSGMGNQYRPTCGEAQWLSSKGRMALPCVDKRVGGRYHFMALFPRPPGLTGARRELLNFMVQRKINRGRQINHPAGHHSIQTNSAYIHHPPIFHWPMSFLPPNQQCQSTEGN